MTLSKHVYNQQLAAATAGDLTSIHINQEEHTTAYNMQKEYTTAWVT
jgi:hypothetical protein